MTTELSELPTASSAPFIITNRRMPVRKLLATASLLAVLATGCASRQAVEPRGDHSKEKAQVERALQAVFEAAEAKDFERLDSLHAYGPKFTKFTSSSPERLDAAASREGEHVSLGPLQDLQMRADGLKIDLFGGVAITTFILDYSFESQGQTVRRKARSTIVFVKQDGTWKICHEHLSSLQP